MMTDIEEAQIDEFTAVILVHATYNERIVSNESMVYETDYRLKRRIYDLLKYLLPTLHNYHVYIRIYEDLDRISGEFLPPASYFSPFERPLDIIRLNFIDHYNPFFMVNHIDNLVSERENIELGRFLHKLLRRYTQLTNTIEADYCALEGILEANLYCQCTSCEILNN